MEGGTEGSGDNLESEVNDYNGGLFQEARATVEHEERKGGSITVCEERDHTSWVGLCNQTNGCNKPLEGKHTSRPIGSIFVHYASRIGFE